MIERVFKLRMHDPRNETIWLTVYADLMTNLALIFLALFGLTMMGGRAIQEALINMKLEATDQFEEIPNQTEFEKLALNLKHDFLNNPDIQVSAQAKQARITFGENVLFNSGDAVLRPDSIALLLQTAKALKNVPYTVVVEGHTDSVPLKSNARYKTNWELSMSRAMAVVRLLITQGGMKPEQFAAAAYEAYHPKASNLTAMGRRFNRRVEISLFEDFPFSDVARSGESNEQADLGQGGQDARVVE